MTGVDFIYQPVIIRFALLTKVETCLVAFVLLLIEYQVVILVVEELLIILVARRIVIIDDEIGFVEIAP